MHSPFPRGSGDTYVPSMLFRTLSFAVVIPQASTAGRVDFLKPSVPGCLTPRRVLAFSHRQPLTGLVTRIGQFPISQICIGATACSLVSTASYFGRLHLSADFSWFVGESEA
jgi:hypothetical protein